MFSWAQPCTAGWKQAWPAPSSAYVKYYFTSGCRPGRKWENVWNWNSSEEFEYNLHTCKVQLLEQLERTVMKTVDNAILPRHHPTTLLFQFGPSILILILLLGIIILMKYGQITNATAINDVTWWLSQKKMSSFTDHSIKYTHV